MSTQTFIGISYIRRISTQIGSGLLNTATYYYHKFSESVKLDCDNSTAYFKVLHIPRNFKISCYMAVLWDLAGFDCLSGIVKNKHLGTDSCHLRPEIPSSDPSAQVLHRSSWSGAPPWSPAASTNLGISAEKRLCAG